MESEENQFDQFERKTLIRKKLIPIWIKVFSWLFLIMGFLAIVCIVFGIFGFTTDLSLYGFETKTPISLVGFFVTSLILYKGFVAYCLLFEKDNAVNYAKIDAVIGIVICFISMFVLPFVGENNIFEIRLEIFLLIPFYRKMDAIEYAWDNLEHQ